MILFRDVFSQATLSVLWLTLGYSLLALFISWILSFVFLFFSRTWILSIFKFLWVLPGFAYALITLTSLRFAGVEHRYSMASVCIAWVIAGVPYLTLATHSAKADLDSRLKEAVQSLGASPLRAFYEFEIRNTWLAQGNALLQQLWLYLTSFSLVMILSGGFPNETLEVGIFTSVRLDRVDFTHALALGIWQMLILIPLRLALSRVRSRSQGAEWAAQLNVQSKKSVTSPTFGCFVSGLLVLFAFIFAASRRLDMSGLIESFATTLTLSIIVSCLTLIWVVAVYRFKLPGLAEIGAWISPMLLTLLWWKGFAFSLLPYVNAVVVQVILFSPWMSRILYPLLSRARHQELEAARSLGCNLTAAWIQVEWPRLRSSFYFSLSLVLALSCTEVTAVLLFSQNDFLPLSVWVQNAFLRFQLDEAWVGTLILVSISYFFLSLKREQT